MDQGLETQPAWDGLIGETAAADGFICSKGKDVEIRLCKKLHNLISTSFPRPLVVLNPNPWTGFEFLDQITDSCCCSRVHVLLC
jgi:hypothetical protein